MKPPSDASPTALAFAGLDPSGGAGIAADLRAFSSCGVWGAAVCTALTVQSTRGVRAVRPVAAALVEAQAREVLDDLDVRAMKTGALGSLANVRVVLRLARSFPRVSLVVDPVMSATRSQRGAAPLDGGAKRALAALAEVAALVTPNWDEAAVLSGRAVGSGAQARAAAQVLLESGWSAVLVKGGHGRGAEAVDWFASRDGVVPIRAPRRSVGGVHGTGCTLAALVTGRLAAARVEPGDTAGLLAATHAARHVLAQAFEAPLRVGKGHRVLDVLARAPPR